MYVIYSAIRKKLQKDLYEMFIMGVLAQRGTTFILGEIQLKEQIHEFFKEFFTIE